MGNGSGQAQSSMEGSGSSLHTGPLPQAPELGKGGHVHVLPVLPGLWIPRIPRPPCLRVKLQAALKVIWDVVWGESCPHTALCPSPQDQTETQGLHRCGDWERHGLQDIKVISSPCPLLSLYDGGLMGLLDIGSPQAVLWSQVWSPMPGTRERRGWLPAGACKPVLGRTE